MGMNASHGEAVGIHLRRGRRQAGITLFELMVVVLILGMIALLGAISVQGIFVRTKISRVQQDHQTIARALENYFLDYGQHPPASVGLEALVRPTAYLGRVPADPFQPDGAPYLYVPVERAEVSYLLISAGPNARLEVPGELIRHAALHEAGEASVEKLLALGPTDERMEAWLRSSRRAAQQPQAIWTPGLPLSDVDMAILRTYLGLGRYIEERGGDGDIIFVGRN